MAVPDAERSENWKISLSARLEISTQLFSRRPMAKSANAGEVFVQFVSADRCAIAEAYVATQSLHSEPFDRSAVERT